MFQSHNRRYTRRGTTTSNSPDVLLRRAEGKTDDGQVTSEHPPNGPPTGHRGSTPSGTVPGDNKEVQNQQSASVAPSSHHQRRPTTLAKLKGAVKTLKATTVALQVIPASDPSPCSSPNDISGRCFIVACASSYCRPLSPVAVIPLTMRCCLTPLPLSLLVCGPVCVCARARVRLTTRGHCGGTVHSVAHVVPRERTTPTR